MSVYTLAKSQTGVNVSREGNTRAYALDGITLPDMLRERLPAPVYLLFTVESSRSIVAVVAPRELNLHPGSVLGCGHAPFLLEYTMSGILAR
jgi:hypothetical protein